MCEKCNQAESPAKQSEANFKGAQASIIERELSELREAINENAVLTDDLRRQLDPVMTAQYVEDSKSTDMNGTPQACVISGQLRGLTDFVRETNILLAETKSRLCV